MASLVSRFARSLKTRGLAATLESTRAHLRGAAPAAAEPETSAPKLSRPVCDSIRTFAQTYPGASTVDLLPPQPLDRTLPHSIDAEIHPSFLVARHKDVPAKYLARIPAAQLLGADGMLLLPTGCYALEWAFVPDSLQAHPDYQHPLGLAVEHKPGSYYSFLWVHWYNYYHWLHDTVLRLYRAIDALPPDTRFIVPAAASPRWLEILSTFGIPSDRCVPFDGTTIWQLEALYFTSYTKRPSYDLPEELNWFRTRMWQNCGVVASSRPRRIFISRQRAEWRRIVNEPEIRDYLAAHSFETHVLEDLSFRDQVCLFAGAQIIVACHGAGCTNLHFAPPGACFVEIFPHLSVPNIYWSLCAGLQIDYWYLIAHAVGAHASPLLNDIHVPLDQFHQLMSAVLESIA